MLSLLPDVPTRWCRITHGPSIYEAGFNSDADLGNRCKNRLASGHNGQHCLTSANSPLRKRGLYIYHYTSSVLSSRRLRDGLKRERDGEAGEAERGRVTCL